VTLPYLLPYHASIILTRFFSSAKKIDKRWSNVFTHQLEFALRDRKL